MKWCQSKWRGFFFFFFKPVDNLSSFRAFNKVVIKEEKLKDLGRSWELLEGDEAMLFWGRWEACVSLAWVCGCVSQGQRSRTTSTCIQRDLALCSQGNWLNDRCPQAVIPGSIWCWSLKSRGQSGMKDRWKVAESKGSLDPIGKS